MSELPYSAPAVGARLRHMRLRFGYRKQSEIADLLKLGRTEWHEWETGNRRPSFQKAERIIDHFGITAGWFFYGRVDELSVATYRKLYPDGDETLISQPPDRAYLSDG